MFYTTVKNKGVVSSDKKVSNNTKKELFDQLIYVLDNSTTTRIMKNNILKLFEELDENQMFVCE